MVSSVVRRLAGSGRAGKRGILIGYDVAAIIVALWGALSARLGEIYLPTNPLIFGAAALSGAVGILALYQLRVYHIVLRFFDLRTVSRIFFGAGIAAATWVLAVYFTRAALVVDGTLILVPRSVGFIYCGFLFILFFMGRYMMVLLVAGTETRPLHEDADTRTKVAIYGANSTGISLADSVRRNRQYQLCAFIDDDPVLRGQILAGVPIYAPTALPDLVRDRRISEAFLALPKATRTQRLSAISRLNELELKVKTVPAPEEIVSGRFTVTDMRPIQVNDLLRRDPVDPLTDLILQAVRGHSILVTGAGGSIGSEICRQISRARPTRIVLLDHSEFALFSIEQQLCELLAALPATEQPEIVAVVGSMMDERLIQDLIRVHGIDTIYHAAAYKHVPLLEHNEVVGVENNVFGTYILAKAAAEARLTRFTMISTDKAVRPESVMGASKRVAELIIQAFAEEAADTRFGIVRFGNVLDSSGSVVQRFREQIRSGGPVTVTHQDITRFFMSIPEATQLVLQASAMASRGEVFVLDMGEPIRIVDLAKNMITLSGMTVRDEAHPAGDIEIVYVGLRPGEKLYEELFIGEDTLPTEHSRIKMAKERSLPMGELESVLESLRTATRARNAKEVRAVLQEMIAPDQGVLVGVSANKEGSLKSPADVRTVH